MSTATLTLIFVPPKSLKSRGVSWLTRSRWAHVYLHFPTIGVFYECGIGRRAGFYGDMLLIDSIGTKGQSCYKGCLRDALIDSREDYAWVDFEYEINPNLLTRYLDKISYTGHWTPLKNCVWAVANTLRGFDIDIKPTYSVEDFYLRAKRVAASRSTVQPT